MCKKIVISDVDGVLNTGQFLYNEFGKQFKVFGPHDADGVKLLKRNGFEVHFISADKRGFKITKSRIDDLGCDLTLVTEGERYDYIDKNFGLNDVVYIGDGLYDARILKHASIGISPNGSRHEAMIEADYVTDSKAGHGAFLDAAILILKHFGINYEKQI